VITADRKLIGSKDLRRRGWTQHLVRRFAGLPDDLQINPHYPGGAPMKLYRAGRVAAIESTEEFKVAKQEAERRQAAAKKAIETKRNATAAWAAKDLPDPVLPPAPRVELVQAAVAWFNGVETWRTGAGRWASTTDCEESLNSIVISFILAQLAEYRERVTRGMEMSPAEAEPIVRAKVLTAIAAAYPWLAMGCERQKEDGITPPSAGIIREAKVTAG
jgi:hypothetical protein